jgi:hypothetical protein
MYVTAEAVPFVDCLFSSMERCVMSEPAALLFGPYTFGLRRWWGFTLLFRPRYAGANLGAIAVLKQYHWPGNVRELRNVIERMMILNPHTIRIERKHHGSRSPAIAARRERPKMTTS